MKKINFESLDSTLPSFKILQHNWPKHLDSLNTKYPNFKEATNKFISKLELLSNENPEIICEYFKKILTEDQDITTLFAKYSQIANKNNELSNQLNYLSEIWDLSTLFKFHAYLLSQNCEYDVPLSQFEKKDQIFSSLKLIGISNQDKEALRKIRNSYKHQFSVVDNFIIDDKKNKILNIDEVNLLYRKIESFTNWSVDIIKGSFRSYYKLLFLLVITILVIEEENDPRLTKRIKETKKYFPTLFMILEKRNQARKDKINEQSNRTSLKIKKRIGLFFSTLSVKLLPNIAPNVYKKLFSNMDHNIEGMYKLIFNKLFNISGELAEIKFENPIYKEQLVNLIESINTLNKIRDDELEKHFYSEIRKLFK